MIPLLGQHRDSRPRPTYCTARRRLRDGVGLINARNSLYTISTSTDECSDLGGAFDST